MDKKVFEAQRVKEAYRNARKVDPSLTQEVLADEFGVTQGLVSAWFSARARIPDTTLLMLCGRLGFDPLDVRPDLSDKLALAKKVLTNEEQAEQLWQMLAPLGEEELSQVELFVEMLLEKKRRETKK